MHPWIGGSRAFEEQNISSLFPVERAQRGRTFLVLQDQLSPNIPLFVGHVFDGRCNLKF